MNPTIAVEALSFAYRSGQELFGGLDYAFPRAAVTAVTGASGRGKSTLLYLLGMLLRPTTGRVLFDGEPVHTLPDRAQSWLRANRFGFVFQDAVLDPSRTVIDAVVEPAVYAGRPRSAAVPRGRELLARFGVDARLDHRPGEISGGQAQRVALCRALINDPVVILADEPTGNLDRSNATVVLAALRDAAREGRTVVVASHDPYVHEQVDEIVALA